MKKVKILNLEIDNISSKDLLASLQQGVVFTPNVDHLMKLRVDPDFQEAYGGSDYKVCDSQFVIYASKFLGTPIQEKISGSDLFPAFCKYHAHNENIKIFILGAAPGVAAIAQDKINQKIGRKIVVAAHSPSFGFENNEQECESIIDLVNRSRATVLAVGVGSPKQEKWIYKYKKKFENIKIFLAIGATIDFEADNMIRAPKWVSSIGLEWFFRLLLEPKRLWRRYLIDDLPFLFLIWKQKRNRKTTAEKRKGKLLGRVLVKIHKSEANSQN